MRLFRNGGLEYSWHFGGRFFELKGMEIEIRAGRGGDGDGEEF
jgi:hypothetical protein